MQSNTQKLGFFTAKKTGKNLVMVKNRKDERTQKMCVSKKTKQLYMKILVEKSSEQLVIHSRFHK